jgi:hypothetical protein
LHLYLKNNQTYLSTNHELAVSLTDDLSIAADYSATSECILPEFIDANTTLHKSCSPYVLAGNSSIAQNVTLTIEPGIEIYMSERSNVFIHGNIQAIGTEDEPIVFKINPKYENASWGALNFEFASDTTHFKHVVIQDASIGPVPVRVGAISSYFATLSLDHLTIANNYGNPISARYSDVRLTNSYIQSNTVSDLINIKYGKAFIDNCEFHGNAENDADGIDYDGIENGIIKNSKIFNVLGFNSDAIDVGEETINLLIDSVIIYNAFDKGISVGQNSSVIVRNSTIVNCNMGLGIKDSSFVMVDHCIFFSNAYHVNCYEKNPGKAGGNAIVQNSVLSNSSEATYTIDDQSTINIHHSLSDNDLLPSNNFNLLENPWFVDPLHHDFSFLASSPCIGNGTLGTDLGSNNEPINQLPNIVICSIFINSENESIPEFIGLLNPTAQTMDLSGYVINRGVQAIIPQGVLLAPGDTFYVTSNDKSSAWYNKSLVTQWTEGKLSNEGESIQLVNRYGLVVDHVSYLHDGKWPNEAFTNGKILMLSNPTLDNHFPENWWSGEVNLVLGEPEKEMSDEVVIYPNPTSGWVTILALDSLGTAEIFSPTGRKLAVVKLNISGTTPLNLSQFLEPVLFVKIDNVVRKIVVLP